MIDLKSILLNKLNKLNETKKMFENIILNLALSWLFFSFLGSLNIELNKNSNIFIDSHLIANQCLTNNQNEIIYFICNSNKIYLNSCNKININCYDFLMTRYNTTFDKNPYINKIHSKMQNMSNYSNYVNEYNIYKLDSNNTIFYI